MQQLRGHSLADLLRGVYELTRKLSLSQESLAYLVECMADIEFWLPFNFKWLSFFPVVSCMTLCFVLHYCLTNPYMGLPDTCKVEIVSVSPSVSVSLSVRVSPSVSVSVPVPVPVSVDGLFGVCESLPLSTQ